jgi:hypothetical protein
MLSHSYKKMHEVSQTPKKPTQIPITSSGNGRGDGAETEGSGADNASLGMLKGCTEQMSPQRFKILHAIPAAARAWWTASC